MKRDLYISVVIAVYERADELSELLQSLESQSNKNFEIVVVDDGSPSPLKPLTEKHQSKLDIQYHYKTNSGPGLSRNFGMKKAKGNYFVFLDSDTTVAPNYIENVYRNLQQNYVDFFGGADTDDLDFSNLQKAINFSMTSFLTTGGIRGSKTQLSKFQPRSFNMGISEKAYQASGGFSDLRIGEDPDLSLRLWAKGFRSAFFSDINVVHKRRSSWAKFARQVYQFGVARPILNQRHPQYVSPTFWFPSLFVLGFIFSLFSLIFTPIFMGFYLFYFILIFLISGIRNQSIGIGLYSIATTWIQFWNYGIGFLFAQWKLNILRQKARIAFPKHFRNGIS